MLNRSMIKQCRLSLEEVQRYAPLITTYYLHNWSGLIRSALRAYWNERKQPASDNGVIQNGLQTKTPASKSRATKKPTRRAPSRRGKTTVSH